MFGKYRFLVVNSSFSVSFLAVLYIESRRGADGTTLQVVLCRVLRVEGGGCTNAASSTEMERGLSRKYMVVNIGKRLVHRYSELGDGGWRGCECELVIPCAIQCSRGVVVVVFVVGRYDAVTMSGVGIHRVVLPSRLLVGDLGDEQPFSIGIAVPTLLTDGLNYIERGCIGIGGEDTVAPSLLVGCAYGKGRGGLEGV